MNSTLFFYVATMEEAPLPFLVGALLVLLGIVLVILPFGTLCALMVFSVRMLYWGVTLILIGGAVLTSLNGLSTWSLILGIPAVLMVVGGVIWGIRGIMHPDGVDAGY